MSGAGTDGSAYPAIFESGWSLFSWIIVFVFFTVSLGQSAPDDKLYERDERFGEPALRRPRGVPRSARQVAAAACAVLSGAATFLVYKRGGFEHQGRALGASLAALGLETLWFWVHGYALWFRTALLVKLATLALYAAVFALYTPVSRTAAGLYTFAFLWALYTLADSALVLYMNRTRVPNEFKALAPSLESALGAGVASNVAAIAVVAATGDEAAAGPPPKQSYD